MKSVLKVSLAALTLAFAVSSHAADKKLVVATDTAFVPFEFKQGDKYVGFDVDLWAAIAKELKLDYELKPMDFSGIIPALQTKNVDLALAVKPKMMLFDEPTSALDPELRHEVLKVMQDLAEEGMTMVIVTHEIGFAEKVASRLIFIDKGRIAEDGDPQVLIKNPPSQRLQEFLQHVS